MLEHTSELPVTEDGTAGNGSMPAHHESWQDELWRRLRKRPARALVAALALGVLAGLPVGAYAAHARTTTYTSQTVLLLDDPLGIATSGDPGLLAKLDDLRYKYSTLASTYAVAGPVANSLHVPVWTVISSTSVGVPPTSLLMDVTGTAATPGFAEELSGAMAQGIANYIQNENSANNIPAADRFSVSTVTPTAPAVGSKASLTEPFAAGVVLFVVVALVVFVAFQLLATAEPVRRRP